MLVNNSFERRKKAERRVRVNRSGAYLTLIWLDKASVSVLHVFTLLTL